MIGKCLLCMSMLLVLYAVKMKIVKISGTPMEWVYSCPVIYNPPFRIPHPSREASPKVLDYVDWIRVLVALKYKKEIYNAGLDRRA